MSFTSPAWLMSFQCAIYSGNNWARSNSAPSVQHSAWRFHVKVPPKSCIWSPLICWDCHAPFYHWTAHSTGPHGAEMPQVPWRVSHPVMDNALVGTTQNRHGLPTVSITGKKCPTFGMWMDAVNLNGIDHKHWCTNWKYQDICLSSMAFWTVISWMA
jgi:hypothetical protein